MAVNIEGSTHMKKFTISVLTLAVTTLAANAGAAQINFGGGCDAFYGSQATCINHYSTNAGNVVATNGCTSQVWIACAIPQNPIPSGGTKSFYFDTMGSAGASITSELDIYTYIGTRSYLSTQSHTFATAGSWEFNFNGITVAQDPQWAYAVAYFLLPPNNTGSVIGVTSLP